MKPLAHLYPITADTKRQAFLYGSFVIEQSNEGWECSIDGQDVIGATYNTVFEAIAAADSIISSGLNYVADLGHGPWSRLTETVRRHIDVYHEGWKLRGVFLRVPLTRFSLWLEWSEVSVGWGQAPTSQRDREVYLGRIKVVLSSE